MTREKIARLLAIVSTVILLATASLHAIAGYPAISRALAVVQKLGAEEDFLSFCEHPGDVGEVHPDLVAAGDVGPIVRHLPGAEGA